MGRSLRPQPTTLIDQSAAFAQMGDGLSLLASAMVDVAKATAALVAEMNAYVDRAVTKLTDAQRSAYFRLVAEGKGKIDALVAVQSRSWLA